MPWSSAALSADELAWAADGKPFLSSCQYVPDSYPNTGGWAVGTLNGTILSTDEATGYEAERASDGYPSKLSKPNSSSTAFTLAFNMAFSTIDFDWFGVINHNLWTLAATRVDLQIADSLSFTLRPMTVASIDIDSVYSSDARFAVLALRHDILTDGQDETYYDNSPTSEGVFVGGTGHSVSDVLTLSDGSSVTVDAVAGGVVTEFSVSVDSSTAGPVFSGTNVTQTGTTGSGTGFYLTPDTANIDSLGSGQRRFSDVVHYRLQITCSSGVPQIGQLILGRRRQQKHHPEAPFDLANQHSSAIDSDTRRGVKTRNVGYKARRHLNVVLKHDTSFLQTEIKEWWRDIGGGGQPFVYVDDPSVDPTSGFWMMFLENPALMYPFVMANTRELVLSATEQGSEFAAQE